MSRSNETADRSHPMDGGIPLKRISRPRRKLVGYTRVSLDEIVTVSRCRTGRAVAFYLLIVRRMQRETIAAARYRRPARLWVQIPTEELRALGLDGHAPGRAGAELVRLGLIERRLRPGRKTVFRLLPPPPLPPLSEDDDGYD